jgi:hypothetical protein
LGDNQDTLPVPIAIACLGGFATDEWQSGFYACPINVLGIGVIRILVLLHWKPDGLAVLEEFDIFRHADPRAVTPSPFRECLSDT